MRVFKVCTVFCAVVALLVASQLQAQEKPAPAPEPELVIPVTQTYPGKESVNISDLSKKKPVVLIFMNTACNACRSEMNFLSKNYDELSKKITIYAVSEDFNPEVQLERYFKNYEYPFQLIVDPEFKIAELFGVTFAPVTVAVSKNKVVYTKKGFSLKDAEALLADLKKL